MCDTGHLLTLCDALCPSYLLLTHKNFILTLSFSSFLLCFPLQLEPVVDENHINRTFFLLNIKKWVKNKNRAWMRYYGVTQQEWVWKVKKNEGSWKLLRFNKCCLHVLSSSLSSICCSIKWKLIFECENCLTQCFFCLNSWHAGVEDTLLMFNLHIFILLLLLHFVPVM